MMSVATQNREKSNDLQIYKQICLFLVPGDPMTSSVWYGSWCLQDVDLLATSNADGTWLFNATSPIFWRTNYNGNRSWRHMASRDSNTNKTIQAWSMLYKLPQKPMMFTPPAGSNHQKHSDTWNFSSDQTQWFPDHLHLAVVGYRQTSCRPWRQYFADNRC